MRTVARHHRADAAAFAAGAPAAPGTLPSPGRGSVPSGGGMATQYAGYFILCGAVTEMIGVCE